MIKALLLIFEPGVTWEKIIRARRSFAFVLFLYLIPLVALSIAGELWGLLEWGRHREIGVGFVQLSRERLTYYGGAQFVMSLMVAFIGALVVKKCGETFHSRHRYDQSFTLVAYSLGPLFVVRLLDAFPSMSPWLAFGAGMTLSVMVLYSGVPPVMLPDPPQAFGLYLASAVLLAAIGALGRYLTLKVLEGRLLAH